MVVPIYGNPHLGKLKHPCNDRSGQRLATKIDRSPSSLMFPSQETPHRRKSQAVATHHLAHLSRWGGEMGNKMNGVTVSQLFIRHGYSTICLQFKALSEIILVFFAFHSVWRCLRHDVIACKARVGPEFFFWLEYSWDILGLLGKPLVGWVMPVMPWRHVSHPAWQPNGPTADWEGHRHSIHLAAS